MPRPTIFDNLNLGWIFSCFSLFFFYSPSYLTPHHIRVLFWPPSLDLRSVRSMWWCCFNPYRLFAGGFNDVVRIRRKPHLWWLNTSTHQPIHLSPYHKIGWFVISSIFSELDVLFICGSKRNQGVLLSRNSVRMSHRRPLLRLKGGRSTFCPSRKMHFCVSRLFRTLYVNSVPLFGCCMDKEGRFFQVKDP